MDFRAPPPKAHCFYLEAPADATIDGLITGIEETVGPRGLKTLQHQGGTKFCIVAATPAAAAKLNEKGYVTIRGTKTPVECVGPQVVYVTVLRLKPFIGDVDLGVALAPYGKVLSITLPTFKSFPYVETGHRLVRMEMARPVPNFLSVRGARVQCEYRGVKRVCSRCDQQGHNGRDCATPWCARCQAFGHDTDTCSEPCRRCSGNHATADCLRPRSYAAAVEDFPALPGSRAEQPPAHRATTEPPRVPPKPPDEAAAGNANLDDNEEFPEPGSDSEASFFEVSSPLSPFGSSDGGHDSGSENHPPAPSVEARKTSAHATTTSDERNTTTSEEPDDATPRPPLGRGAGRRVNAKPAKPATAPGTSASGKPAATPSNAPPTTTKASPRKQPASAPERPTDAADAMEQTNITRYDPAKRGPPSSSDSDVAGEAVKKLCVPEQTC